MKEPREKLHHNTQTFGGAGGGGKSGSGSGSFHEATDTLISKSYARIKDIISVGPIEGFVTPTAPLKSVYLNGTPIENADGTSYADGHTISGSKKFTTAGAHFNATMKGRGITGEHIPDFTQIAEYVSATEVTLTQAAIATDTVTTWALGGSLNFHDFNFYFLTGTSDQSYLPGFEAEEDTHAVTTPIKELLPWSQTLSDNAIDKVRIDVRFGPPFQEQKTDGDIIGTEVRIKISLKSGSGVFVVKIDDTIKGKATSAYVRTYELDLTSTPAPWMVKVERVTKDSFSQLIRNDTSVESYTEVTSGKLSHPLTAIDGVTMDAQQFGAIPTRAYYIKGLIIDIPTNYDPITRAYSGIWDGNFKPGWTNNPAWCWYAMATNPIWGAGGFIAQEDINIFALYQIAQYCDVLVPDGKGGTEPRMVCNLYLQTREDALKVLSDMASIFRGMLYYADGAIVAVQDAPGPVQYLFTPDNVLNGQFTYSGTGRRARHNVALVKWNDLDDQGKEKTEYVEDQDDIAERGFVNELSLTGFGCTSQGQAHRVGVWALITEKILTDTVTFQTGLEGAFVRPGDLINIQDPFRAGEVLSGRVIDHSGTSVVLDRPVTLVLGHTHFFQYLRSDTSVWTAIQMISGGGTYSTIVLATTPAIQDGDVWQLAKDTLVPQTMRVLNVVAKDEATAEITALQYNESIYDFVDLDHELEDPPISILPDPLKVIPPGPITVQQINVILPDRVRIDLQVAWGKSTDKFLKDYEISHRYQLGLWQPAPRSKNLNLTYQDVKPGEHDFSVVAYNLSNVPSTPVLKTYIVSTGNPIPLFSITGLELFGQGNNTEFNTRDAKFVWRLNSPVIPNDVDELKEGIDDPSFQCFQVEIFIADTNTRFWGPVFPKEPIFIFTEEMNAQGMHPALPTPRFRIEVLGLDIYGQGSERARLTVTNPPPAAPVNFGATSAFQSSFLIWDSSNDVDLQWIEIHRYPTNFFVPNTGIIAKVTAVRNGHQRYTDVGLETNKDYYYFLRAQDTFGNFSAPTVGAHVTPGTVDATDLEDFAIDATKIFANTAIPQGAIFKSNDPANGSISWNAHNIVYRGKQYPIAAGNTGTVPPFKPWVYWRGPIYPGEDNTKPPTRAAQIAYATADTNPIDITTLPGGPWSNNYDFQIARNLSGIFELAWYGFANAVIGSAYIMDAAIVRAKIALLAVDDARIAEAGISKLAVGSVNADTLTVGLNTVDLQLNSSFEQDASGWVLQGGAVISVGGQFGGVAAQDGIRHLYCSDTVALSGALSRDFIPVLPSMVGKPSIYTVSGWIRTGGSTLTAQLGILEYDDNQPTPSFVQSNYAVNGVPVGTLGVWKFFTKQVTLSDHTFFIKVIARCGAVQVAGLHVRFDNVRCCQIIPDDQLVGILANKITTGQIRSFDYVKGVSGWQIDLQGIGEFKRIIERDPLIYRTITKPTFTNDFSPFPVINTSLTYDQDTPCSIRVHGPSGLRMRMSTTGAVTMGNGTNILPTPFVGWHPANHGGLASYDVAGNLIPGREGVGPDDFIGFIQSDGTLTGVPNKRTTVWRACAASDPTGTDAWDQLGPEAMITSTYVPVDTNKWPVVAAPYIYRASPESPPATRGAAGYIVRADCTDSAASIFRSSDGITYLAAAYIRGNAIALAAGANIYFKAKRGNGFRDSAVAFFANTASSLPNENDGGGTGGFIKNLP